MNSNKNNVLMLTNHFFPCKQAVLESVFSVELGKKVNLIWYQQGSDFKDKHIKWNNSIAIVKKRKKNVYLAKFYSGFFFFFNFFQIINIIQKKEISIIFVRDMPFLTCILKPLKSRYNFKLFYQCSAPLGDMNIDYFKSFKLNNFSYNSLKSFIFVLIRFIKGIAHNVFLKSALIYSDVIFSITEYHRKTLSIYADKNKIFPLTMGVNYNWLSRIPEPIDSFNIDRSEYAILAYFGSLSLVRNPVFILQIASYLLKKGVKFKLLMIGKTDNLIEEYELKKLCDNLNLSDSVIFTGYVDRNKLQDYLSYCDLTISAIPPVSYYKISSPTKLYESLGNGIPVIGNSEIFEQNFVLKNSVGGILVPYNVVAFGDAVMKLINNKSLKENFSANGKSFILKNYTYSSIAAKILPFFS